MSVLIKRTDTNSSGGSSKGYPPGNVSNVEIKGSYKKVTIKWSDPEDIVVGDKTLSTWKSTILVRKKESIPTSISDGDIVLENTERNKYKDTAYSDNDLEFTTYYYRFFTCNTDGIYNNDSNMIYSTAVVNFDPILKNNSWEHIAAASESGIASSLWNIGDEIDITLSGTYNETVTLQIWDFNHFDKSDGSGKAGICFGMKNLMSITQYMSTESNNMSGWGGSYIRKNIMPGVISSLPSNLQKCIKNVNTYTHAGGYSSASKIEIGTMLEDKIFIPGFREIFGDSYTNQSNGEQGQIKFPIFTDNNSRIKKKSNGSEKAYKWWTRSPSQATTSSSCTYYCIVSDSGSKDGGYQGNSDKGICFCFNV